MQNYCIGFIIFVKKFVKSIKLEYYGRKIN